MENLIRDLDQEITAIENKRNTLGKAAGEIALVNARQKINNTIVERGIQLTEQQKLAIETSLGMLEKSTDGLERDTDVRKQAAADVEEILKSAAEANEADLQQRLARIDSQTRIQQGTEQEIADNEKLIAALQKGEAEYDKTVVLLDLLNQYREAGIALTPEQVAALDDVSSKMVEQGRTLEDLKQRHQDLKRHGEQLGSAFSGAFEDAIFSGQKFSEVMRGLAEDVSRLMLRIMVTEPLARSLASAFGAGGTSLFGLFGRHQRKQGYGRHGAWCRGDLVAGDGNRYTLCAPGACLGRRARTGARAVPRRRDRVSGRRLAADCTVRQRAWICHWNAFRERRSRWQHLQLLHRRERSRSRRIGPSGTNNRRV